MAVPYQDRNPWWNIQSTTLASVHLHRRIQSECLCSSGAHIHSSGGIRSPLEHSTAHWDQKDSLPLSGAVFSSVCPEAQTFAQKWMWNHSASPVTYRLIQAEKSCTHTRGLKYSFFITAFLIQWIRWQLWALFFPLGKEVIWSLFKYLINIYKHMNCDKHHIDPYYTAVSAFVESLYLVVG